MPEIEIIDIAENVCNLKKQEADWMLRIDIVEKGDKLEVNLLELRRIRAFLILLTGNCSG